MTLVDLEELVEHSHPSDLGHGPVRTGLRWDVNPALARSRAARPKGESSATASPPVAVPTTTYVAVAPPPQSWTVTSRDDLHRMCRERRDQLDVSLELLDGLCGWAERLAGKLLSPRPMKRLGPVSLPLLVQALALRVVRVDLHDAETFLELSRSRTNLWQVLWACLDQRLLTLTFQECPARAARMRKRWVKRQDRGPRRPRLVADQRPAA